MGFFSSRPSEKLVTIVDIGSASVGVAIVAMRQDIHTNTCPQILWSERQQINFDDNLDFKRFFNAILSATKDLLVKSQTQKLGRSQQIFCFLSSPLFISQSRIIKVSRDQPTKVTSKFLDEITSSEAASLQAKHKRLYPELLNDESVVLENKIMSLLLNGYETRHPYDKEASKIEINQFVSLASKTVLEKLNEAITAATHINKIEFHSYSFAVFSSFRDVFGLHGSFISVDISGELTDVSVVSQGILLENLSFPLGRNFLTRKIVKEFATVNAEALSLLRMYLDGKTTTHARAQLEKVLKTTQGEWLELFKTTLRQVLESTLVPETMFVFGDSDLAPLFSDWINHEDMSEFTLTNRPLSVKHLEDSLLKSFCDPSSTKCDTILLAEALFCVKISK